MEIHLALLSHFSIKFNGKSRESAAAAERVASSEDGSVQKVGPSEKII